MHFLLIAISILSYQTITAIEYHLPETVRPIHYEIIVQLDEDPFNTEKFKGEVKTTIQVLNQTQEIQLHATNLTEIRFYLRSTTPPNNISFPKYIRDPVTEIITITCKDVLTPGQYQLFGTYYGILDRYDPHGLYRSAYRDHGTRDYLANTDMALTNARKVFPCWDEPKFKATFNLSVIYPKGYNVLANSLQNGNVKQISNTLDMVNFENTPLMSTYLVAFIVSKFTCSSVTNNILYRVCSKLASEDERQYALEMVQKSVHYLEKFTGIPYNISGLGKLDLIAIPYLQETGMENWGLIYCTQKSLLYNEYSSSNKLKQEIATVISHEVSHMWFGNLVTAKWWSDAFLNEGLATYFELLATAEIEPRWELEKQFVVDQLQTVLAADSSQASYPLVYDVQTPEDIWGRFDAISYNKGASIVRMIAYAIELDNFQNGIRKYLQENQFGNTLAVDLWSTLGNFSQLGYNLNEIARNWTYQAGYPVVHAELKGNDIILTQKCFFYSGSSSTKWHIPITYTTSRNPKKCINTSTKTWLIPHQALTVIENKIIHKSDWIIFNNLQIGYYRVSYDDNLWNRIEQVLIKNSSEICSINRAQIVDDLFNFAKAGQMSYSKVLNRIMFLKNDTEYYPWKAALRALDHILTRSTGLVKTKLENYTRELIDSLYKSTPLIVSDPKDQIYSLKQTLAVTWACRLNHSDCVNNSLEIFAAYKKGIRPNKNLFLPICCTSLRNSHNLTEDWTFLWNKFKETTNANEEDEMIQALSCTTNETILEMFLHLAINESLIERQHSMMVWKAVLAGAPQGVNVALKFLINKYEEIANYYKNDDTLKLLMINLGPMLMEQSQVDKLTNFEKYAKEIKNITAKTVIMATANLESNRKLKSELEKFFKISASTSIKINKNVYLAFILVIIRYVSF